MVDLLLAINISAIGEALQFVDISPVLENIQSQIQKGWESDSKIQIDLDEVHRQLKAVGVPLPEDATTLEKVQMFTVSLCRLLGWQATFCSNNEDWWVEITL